MGVDAEITEGKVVIGTTNRTRTECIFEVMERIKSWVRPVPGTLYIIERTSSIEDRGIKLRSPMDDSEVADTTAFTLADCELPDTQLLLFYHSMPNI